MAKPLPCLFFGAFILTLPACDVRVLDRGIPDDAAQYATDAGGVADAISAPVDASADAVGDAWVPDAGLNGPRLCAGPAAVDFGAVLLGDKGIAGFKLKACGTVEVTVNQIVIENQSEEWFSLESIPPTPFVLAPGDESAPVIACVPEKEGNASAEAVVASDASNLPGGEGRVRLACKGAEPPACIIKADPSRLDFGALAAGRKSTKDLFLLNLGERSCLISGMSGPSRPEFKILSITSDVGLELDGAPFAIGPRGRAKVAVEFTSPGSRKCGDDWITFVNDSINAPSLEVWLHGGCGDFGLCKFKVQPLGSLNFGNVGVRAKKTMGVTFENVGLDTCEITQSKFGQQTGNWFSFARDHVYPIRVDPANSKKIEIACEPGATGPAPDATGMPDLSGANVLNVSTTDPAQPRNGGASACASPGWCHKLLCSGVTSVLDVLPNPVDFGSATVGCNTSEIVVSLFNNGTGALIINQLQIIPDMNPPDFLISSAPPTPWPINAGSSVKIKVKYHPSIEGAETATLRLHTDASNVINGVFDVPLRGQGTLAEAVTDSFEQASRPKVDVLWCVDNSKGMGDHQQVLAKQFMSWVEAQWVDYQIGVVTTEIQQAARGDTGDMIYPGVLFQRSGYPRIIANRPPPGAGPPYQPVNVDRSEAFAANAMPGECCSDAKEACMEAVRLALSDPLIGDDQANKGFLRPDATLSIVMLSDEDDQSPASVGYYSAFLQGLKADASRLRLSVVAEFEKEGTPQDPPSPKACGVDGGNGAVRYAAIFTEIAAGLAEPVCTTDWINRLAGTAPLVSFVAVMEYYLSRWPDPSTLVVKVNGADVRSDPVSGYSYDPGQNSIVFGSGAVPPEGARIEVTYRAACY